MNIFPPKDDSLLLLIDFQTGFLKPFKEKVKKYLEEKISLLIETIKFYNIPIIVMEQNNEKLGNTIEPIQKSLGEFYKPNNKFIFSGFKDKNIKNLMQSYKKNNIIICGIETHICVLQTASDLINQSYKVHIIGDAVGSRFKPDWKFGIDKLNQIGANILTVEMLLFGYLETSSSKDFKHFLPFLK